MVAVHPREASPGPAAYRETYVQHSRIGMCEGRRYEVVMRAHLDVAWHGLVAAGPSSAVRSRACAEPGLGAPNVGGTRLPATLDAACAKLGHGGGSPKSIILAERIFTGGGTFGIHTHSL